MNAAFPAKCPYVTVRWLALAFPTAKQEVYINVRLLRETAALERWQRNRMWLTSLRSHAKFDGEESRFSAVQPAPLAQAGRVPLRNHAVRVDITIQTLDVGIDVCLIATTVAPSGKRQGKHIQTSWGL